MKNNNFKAFTRLVNPLCSGLDSLLRPWHCQARNPRIPSCHSSGFTLAETLIALTVLGIIASITLPPIVRRQIEASNRTKIKKIMGVYDSFIQKTVIENDIKSEQAFRDWADSANVEGHDCQNSSSYFKITEFVGDSDGVTNKCEFANPDGVVLNITNPLNPIVAPNKKDYEKYKAGDTDKGYKFVVSFDKKTGAFRVNDIGYEMALAQAEQDEDKIEELEKLYAFINNEKKETIQSNFAKNCVMQTTADGDPKQCKYGDVTFTEQTFTAGNYDPSIVPCYLDYYECAKLAANSKAEGGTYFTANIGGNITWNDAKTECAKMNAEVATTAQLQQMNSQNKLKCQDGSTLCSFWAAEATSDGSCGVGFSADTGSVYDYGTKDGSYDFVQVVCVGK